MTDVDDLPFHYPEAAPANPAAKAKRCRHPRDRRRQSDAGVSCGSCGKFIDWQQLAKGRSSRRLGGDQERRIERVYGPTKIGERGDPVDHLGRLFKWQSKASRRAAPAWIKGPLERMAGLYGDRIPVLILSFVRPGVKPEDYIVISGRDWLALHGRDSDEELQPVDPYLEEVVSQ